MPDEVTLDVTTIEENVTVETTAGDVVEIQVVAPTGPAGATGPAGPNSVTSATTSDGTATLSIADLEVVGGEIYTNGEYSNIYTQGATAHIFTLGSGAEIYTEGELAQIYTTGASAQIYTAGAGATIGTQGANATIYTQGTNATISTAGSAAHIQTSHASAAVKSTNFAAVESGGASLVDGSMQPCLTWSAGGRNLTIPSGTATTFNTTSYTFGTGAASAFKTALGITDRYVLLTNTDLVEVNGYQGFNLTQQGVYVVTGAVTNAWEGQIVIPASGDGQYTLINQSAIYGYVYDDNDNEIADFDIGKRVTLIFADSYWQYSISTPNAQAIFEAKTNNGDGRPSHLHDGGITGTTTFNTTAYTYTTGAAAAHRTALGLTTLATTTAGTNVANFLASPTSANLASALTDENGTGGGFVRAEGATLTTPTLVGTPVFNATAYTYGTGAAEAHRTALGFITKHKTATTSRASTTTRTDDPDLTFDIGANETWVFELSVLVGQNASNIQVSSQLTSPAGSIISLRVLTGRDGGVLGLALPNAANAPTLASTRNGSYHITATVFGGETAGTVAFAWAQENSNATASTILRGSYLLAQKIN